MSFQFASHSDQETFMSLKGLSNKNNGFFKSVKQAQFLFKQYSVNNIHTPDEAKRYFGVPLEDGQICVTVTAHTQWADYGARSIVPVLYVFVLDKMGVVSAYKVGGNGNLRDGWGPDPTKCKLTWSRPNDAVCSWSFPTEQEVAKQKASEVVSQWLGLPGEKIESELSLVRSREVGYGRFGEMFLSVFKDAAGNIVNVWRDLGLEVGQTVKVKGTIKATDDYKGTKQTTLTRVKVI